MWGGEGGGVNEVRICEQGEVVSQPRQAVHYSGHFRDLIRVPGNSHRCEIYALPGRGE